MPTQVATLLWKENSPAYSNDIVVCVKKFRDVLVSHFCFSNIAASSARVTPANTLS